MVCKPGAAGKPETFKPDPTCASRFKKPGDTAHAGCTSFPSACLPKNKPTKKLNRRQTRRPPVCVAGDSAALWGSLPHRGVPPRISVSGGITREAPLPGAELPGADGARAR